MHGETSPPPIQTQFATAVRAGTSWVALVALACFAALVVYLAIRATRVFLPQRDSSDLALAAFLGAVWVVALCFVALTIVASVRAWRFGPSILYLDEPAARLGDWISGELNASSRLRGAEIHLRLECVHTVSTTDSNMATVEWCATAVLDGTNLERKDGRVYIPFAIRIQDKALPSRPGKISWVEWALRVDARAPGVSYSAEFPVQVLPFDRSRPVAEVPPRAMPEIPSERLAQRLAVATVGDTTVIYRPLPVRRTALLILFSLAALALAAPGMPWTAALDQHNGRWVAASASAFLAAGVQFVLMMTTLRIEVRGASVRLVRGLFGLGFHSTIPATDVVGIQETYETNVKAGTWYGAALRAPYGKLSPLVLCFRDPALAKALVHRLESVLVRRV